MSLIRRVKALYRRLDDWLLARPKIAVIVAVLLPGITIAAISSAIGDSVVRGFVWGLLSGLVFTILMVSINGWPGSAAER